MPLDSKSNPELDIENCTVVFTLSGFSKEFEYELSPFEAVKLEEELRSSRTDSSKLAFLFRFRDIRHFIVHVDLKAVNYVRFWGLKHPAEGDVDPDPEPEFDEASYATKEGNGAFYDALNSQAWNISLFIKEQQDPLILELVNGIHFDTMESSSLAMLNPKGYFECVDGETGCRIFVNVAKLVLLEAHEIP